MNLLESTRICLPRLSVTAGDFANVKLYDVYRSLFPFFILLRILERVNCLKYENKYKVDIFNIKKCIKKRKVDMFYINIYINNFVYLNKKDIV